MTVEQLEPLRGTVQGESGEAMRFEGWLELLAVLSEWVERTARRAEEQADT